MRRPYEGFVMGKERESRAFELRAEPMEAGGAVTKIAGYAAVFNTISYGEMIAPGAFTKTLAEQRDIKAYWSHDANGSLVLGRTTNGTLTLREDDHGLYVEILPNLDTDWGRSALASVARGDVSQMSFGFSPVKESFETVNDENIRVIKEARLYEVSPVAEPWYPTTEAAARNKCECCEPKPVQADHFTRERERKLWLKVNG